MAKVKVYSPEKSITKLQLSIAATIAGRVPPALQENPLISTLIAVKAIDGGNRYLTNTDIAVQTLRKILASYDIKGVAAAVTENLSRAALRFVNAFKIGKRPATRDEIVEYLRNVVRHMNLDPDGNLPGTDIPFATVIDIIANTYAGTAAAGGGA